MGLPFPGDDDVQPWIVADTDLEGLDVPDESHLFMSDSGTLSVLPLPEGRVAVGAPTSRGRGEISGSPRSNLIRPDGYIGHRCPAIDRARFHDYLDHVGLGDIDDPRGTVVDV